MSKDNRPYPRFRNLIKSAKRRSVNVNIDIEIWKKIMLESDYKCKYCGDDVKEETGGGLDRLDNNVGYVETNLVVCCKYCNSMKSSLDKSDFIKHVTKIYKNNYK